MSTGRNPGPPGRSRILLQKFEKTRKKGAGMKRPPKATLFLRQGERLLHWQPESDSVCRAQKTGQARSKDVPLRPPGAIDEDEFTGLCIRCGNCVRACPSGIIHPDTGQAGILGFLAPLVRYEREYCNEECNACVKACPSGALQSLNLEQKNKYIIGTASVDTSLCLWGYSDCNTCIRACPYEAVEVPVV